MDIQRRHLLVVALLSVLLVNLELSQAHSIQDSLPSLIIEDENIKADSDKAAASSIDSLTKVESIEAKKIDNSPASEEPAKELTKSIPYEINSSSSQPEKSPEADLNKPQVAESSEPSVTSQKSATVAPAAVEDTTKPKPAAASDISDLLANKNDEENDLNGVTSGAKPAASPVESEESKPKAEVDEDKKSVELDSPVDVDSSQESGNQDRFHYSVGQPTTKPSEAPAAEAPKVTEEKSEPASSTESSKEKSEAPLDVSAVPSSSSSAPIVPVEEKPTKKVEEESTIEGKRVDSGSKIKPVEVDSSTPEKQPAPESSPPSPVSEPSSTSLAPPSSSTSERPIEVAVVSEKPKESPEVSTASGSSEKPKEASSSLAPPASSASPTPIEKATTEKAASVPSVLAVALGTALGSAVNPILQASKPAEKPLVGGPTTTKPATRSTTKKSSNDRWDLWIPSTGSSSTSTTTGAPSTRRRPILPSIRRRFRPYNRFSPFPWAGVDSYSPAGGETEFLTPGESPVGHGSGKPRRRPSTTEAPKSSSSSPRDDDDDDEVPTLGSTPSSRRRNQNGSKRRHHYHPHRHHHHQHHHRRFHSGDRDERPPFGEPAAFEPSFGPRPPFGGNGFGMYSPGSTFDLLNPFSGWLDPLTGSSSNKPSRVPSARPPVGSRPAGGPRPVEGEFNEPESHHQPDEHHHTRPHGNGRDDYDNHHDHHDHHHDCHDHDYDHHHDHHHRPARPHREPYRPAGDYDTYPPSSGPYGSRPSRPYNRQRESGSPDTTVVRENTEFSSRQSPVAPRRVPSIFSPFDSLFGTLDDELFGLRSSFLDSPLKAAASEPGSQHFDAVVTSPKITLPSATASSPDSAKDSPVEPHKHQASAGSTAHRGGLESDNKHGKPYSATGIQEASADNRRARDISNCSQGLLCYFIHKQSPLLDFLQRI